MTKSADFTPEEWNTVREGPTSAGLILVAAGSATLDLDVTRYGSAGIAAVLAHMGEHQGQPHGQGKPTRIEPGRRAPEAAIQVEHGLLAEPRQLASPISALERTSKHGLELFIFQPLAQPRRIHLPPMREHEIGETGMLPRNAPRSFPVPGEIDFGKAGNAHGANLAV